MNDFCSRMFRLMCIAFVFVNENAGPGEWQLVVANNRDEHFHRPALQADWDSTGCLCGKDMTPGKEGGTWLGIKKSGKIGMLLNILESKGNQGLNPNAAGRGSFVKEYLSSSATPQEFLGKVAETAKERNGFSLLLFQRKLENACRKWNLCYYSNQGESGVQTLPSGIYGFSNSVRDRPFRKVQHGLQKFQSVLLKHLVVHENVDQVVTDLQDEVLRDQTRHCPDPQICSQWPDGPSEKLDALSSCYVLFPAPERYGTRTHTVILIDGADNVVYDERSMVNIPEDIKNAKWESKRFQFKLDDSLI